MESLLCAWDAPKYLIFSSNVPALLYYSHFLALIVALLLGIIVLLKGKTNILNITLFTLNLAFSFWVIFDLIAWAHNRSDLILFLWALTILMESIVYISALYLTYVFIGEKDISFLKKILFLILISPSIFLLSTFYNLKGINLTTGIANEGFLALYFSYSLEALVAIWIIAYAIIKFRSAEKIKRKKIILFSSGIILFLLSFSWSNLISSFTLKWDISQFGLFGMPIFVGFLSYLIVKFEVFKIKILSTQALIFALIILIGSLFFVLDLFTIRMITGFTLILTIVLGYVLVRSVKLEVERKEELEKLSAQLAGANDKLHQLDKAKSEFISIASHQLRTPLTAIKGFVSLLLEGTYGQVPDTQKSALEKVYVSNERLVQLVEDLLNISRIESGRMEFDFQEGQMEDLIDEAVNTLELSVKAKGLYLDWKKPDKMSNKIKIDITKIKEVISNMIDNSIKYTQKGGVTVRVESGSFFDHTTMEQKKIVRVIVSDTGIGMDQEDIENIFHKFVRGKEISHYHTDGTGLGMFIAKKVTEAHKGRIWAESSGREKGSRFILELPVS